MSERLPEERILALAVLERAVDDLTLGDAVVARDARDFLVRRLWDSLWGDLVGDALVRPQVQARVARALRGAAPPSPPERPRGPVPADRRHAFLHEWLPIESAELTAWEVWLTRTRTPFIRRDCRGRAMLYAHRLCLGRWCCASRRAA